MTIIAPRLGVYQRMIAEQLSSIPMTAEEAYNIISYTDLGYASATLIRLKQKNIAEEIETGKFIRGPQWKEVAVYYGWPFNEGTTEGRTKTDFTLATKDNDNETPTE